MSQGQDSWILDNAPLFDTNGAVSEVVLYRNPNSFQFKDAWGVGARRIWATANVRNRTVAYLGVGSGAEVVQTLRNGQIPATIFLNDIVAANLEVCVVNLQKTVEALAITHPKTISFPGRAEEALTLTTTEGLGKIDRIFGCLPQVPSYNQPDGEQVAHVYNVCNYPSMPEWGFGVLHAALVNSRECLSSKGTVSLVISGRVPWEATCKLFDDTGFGYPQVAGCFLVRHHLETPLSYLQELTGVRLFRDEAGFEEICAKEAEAQRLAIIGDGKDRSKLNVFHWVFVLEGTPK